MVFDSIFCLIPQHLAVDRHRFRNYYSWCWTTFLFSFLFFFIFAKLLEFTKLYVHWRRTEPRLQWEFIEYFSQWKVIKPIKHLKTSIYDVSLSFSHCKNQRWIGKFRQISSICIVQTADTDCDFTRNLHENFPTRNAKFFD